MVDHVVLDLDGPSGGRHVDAAGVCVARVPHDVVVEVGVARRVNQHLAAGAQAVPPGVRYVVIVRGVPDLIVVDVVAAVSLGSDLDGVVKPCVCDVVAEFNAAGDELGSVVGEVETARMGPVGFHGRPGQYPNSFDTHHSTTG